MSFSKSRVKRFNDISPDVCAPPVGTYDPKLPESSQSSGHFSASPVERLKDLADGSYSSTTSTPRCLVSDAINKKNLGQLTKSNSFKHSPATALRLQGNAKIQQYEQEIKQLLMERSALLKQLTTKDEDGKKIFSRMQAAIRERSSFQASVASFEKENKELRRINEIYKIKFETFEGIYKKKDINMELANLRSQLASKNHQISDLRLEVTCIREEQEYSAMKLSDKYRGITKISLLMIDAMEILKYELKRLKDHVVKMQITEECAEEFYECISAQLQYLDEKMVHYQSSVHDIIQENQISDLNSNLRNSRGTPTKLPKAMAISDEISGHLSSSQPDDQDCHKHDIERIMSSTLDNEHQKLPTAENYFDYLEKCRAEDENDFKRGELVHQLDKELSDKRLEPLSKSNQPFIENSVAEVRSELLVVKDEYENLKLQHELYKQSTAAQAISLEEQVAKAQETCDLKNNEIANLNEVVDALSKQMANLSDLLKEETQKTAVQSLLSEERSSQIANLEDKLNIAKDRESEMAMHITNLKCFLEELSGKLQDNEEALILLKNEINTRETKINCLNERESLLLGQVNHLTEKGNVSEQVVQKLTRQSSELMDTMKVQESLLQKTKDALSTCEINLAENKAKCKEYQLLAEKLKDEIAIETQRRKNVAKELAAQNELLSALRAEYEICQAMNEQLKEEKNVLTNELHNTSHKLMSVKEELAGQIGKCEKLAESFNQKEDEARVLMDKLQEASHANDRSLDENHEIEELKKELICWKTQCEELQAKIAPFQEQLDSYAIDRQILMSKNMETMSDLKALSLQYATSLGHQNRKQKIHYMSNLKAENFNLKEENGKLWADILKLRNSREPPKTPTNLNRIGSSSTSRSFHTPLNKENKDSGTNTPLRDCSNSDK